MKEKQKHISITKASGETAPFAPEKLQRSLVRSGAPAEQGQTILSFRQLNPFSYLQKTSSKC